MLLAQFRSDLPATGLAAVLSSAVTKTRNDVNHGHQNQAEADTVPCSRPALSRPSRSHPLAGRGGIADQGGSADQQRYGDAPAGAVAVPRRHRGEGSQGLPVHERHRQQRPQIRHPGAGRRACRQSRDLPHRNWLPFEEIDARWVRAAQSPIPPNIVEDAPCHEIVITGKALDKPGQGLDGIPLPISTPGWDIPRTRRSRNTSPRIRILASRTWATTAAR